MPSINLSPAARKGQSGALRFETPIYLVVKGRRRPVAGVVFGDEGEPYLRKFVDESVHLVRRPFGIAFAASVVAEAAALGAANIRVVARDTGRVFRCRMDYFQRHSFSQSRSGLEVQRFLSLEHWEIDGAPSELAAMEAAEEARRARLAALPAQLGLFGGDA